MEAPQLISLISTINAFASRGSSPAEIVPPSARAAARAASASLVEHLVSANMAGGGITLDLRGLRDLVRMIDRLLVEDALHGSGPVNLWTLRGSVLERMGAIPGGDALAETLNLLPDAMRATQIVANSGSDEMDRRYGGGPAVVRQHVRRASPVPPPPPAATETPQDPEIAAIERQLSPSMKRLERIVDEMAPVELPQPLPAAAPNGSGELGAVVSVHQVESDAFTFGLDMPAAPAPKTPVQGEGSQAPATAHDGLTKAESRIVAAHDAIEKAGKRFFGVRG